MIAFLKYEKLGHVKNSNKFSIRHYEASGPYLVAAFFLLLLIFISNMQFSNNTALTSSYLSTHIILELVGILVSFAIFTVGWATYQNARDADILILTIASFAVGALDLGHMLSYSGMPEFFGPNGPNKAIQFWFASRSTGALALLYIGLSRPRLSRIQSLQWILFAISFIWVAICFWLILFHVDSLPAFVIPGQGIMNSKIVVEWTLIFFTTLAGVLLFVGAEKRENMNVRWMACAIFLYGMSGYFFVLNQSGEDVFDFSGHCFKAASFLILYRAVFVECISRPYERVKQLATEAAASNSSKSRFLANVSHEFRTPLGVISGFGDLLLNSGKLAEPLDCWAQTIVRNSKQLSLLIDDLLDLAKAETEKLQIRLTRVNLSSLVAQVKEALQVQSKNSIEIKIDNKLNEKDFVVTDEMRLRQILVNVVSNAIKFTTQGYIRISIERISLNKIEICVQDTGIGIKSSDRSLLFQPFTQVSNTKSRGLGGTGLGLALSRKLAQLLGGNLDLKWSEPDVGSCFAFTFQDHLNEVDLQVVPMSEKSDILSAPSFMGRRILIAEDSEDNRYLLKSYLSSTGVEITFAENGRMALELARCSNYDLILMDIQMPELDGFEATAALRRDGWTGQIVALTAHALQPERDRAMKNGFNHYLVKPIKKETLWETISECLK